MCETLSTPHGFFLNKCPITGLRSGLWPLQHIDFWCFILMFNFFSHFVIDLLVCLCSLFCCMPRSGPNLSRQTDFLTLDFIIIWYKEKFMVYSDCKVPWSYGCKTSPDLYFSTTVLYSRHLCWYASGLPKVALWIMARDLHLSSKDIVPESIQMQLFQSKPCCHAL